MTQCSKISRCDFRSIVSVRFGVACCKCVGRARGQVGKLGRILPSLTAILAVFSLCAVFSVCTFVQRNAGVSAVFQCRSNRRVLRFLFNRKLYVGAAKHLIVVNLLQRSGKGVIADLFEGCTERAGSIRHWEAGRRTKIALQFVPRAILGFQVFQFFDCIRITEIGSADNHAICIIICSGGKCKLGGFANYKFLLINIRGKGRGVIPLRIERVVRSQCKLGITLIHSFTFCIFPTA